jgi:FkbM family methyltransferase
VLLRLPGLPPRIDKPYYVFRPEQVVRRLLWSVGPKRAPRAIVQLPWGVFLEVVREEAIGSGIGRTGVHDLTATETLWRLVTPGDVVVDVGANIGYMTGLMAVRAGPAGQVIAYEAHPTIRQQLERNVARLGHRAAAIHVRGVALSDRRGYSELVTGPGFAHNQGTATLAGTERWPDVPAVRVTTVTLDDEFPSDRLDCVKIDAEGHEHAVLRGAEGLLGEHRIRHVLYEDHARYPTAASELLERHGYKVLLLARGFTGPRIAPPSDIVAGLEAPIYLATVEPNQALRALRTRGWRALRAI